MIYFKKRLYLSFLFLSLFVFVWSLIWHVFIPKGLWENHDGFCGDICENSHQCIYDVADRPLVQQPINAWTNTVFLVVGLVPIVTTGRYSVDNIIFLLSNVYVFVCSFMFHASLTYFWNGMDYAGIYTCVLVLLCRALNATTCGSFLTWNRLAIIPLVGCIFFSSVMPHMHDDESSAAETLTLIATLIFLLAVLIILITGIVLMCIRIGKIRKNQADKARRNRDSCFVVSSLEPIDIKLGMAQFQKRYAPSARWTTSSPSSGSSPMWSSSKSVWPTSPARPTGETYRMRQS